VGHWQDEIAAAQSLLDERLDSVGGKLGGGDWGGAGGRSHKLKNLLGHEPRTKVMEKMSSDGTFPQAIGGFEPGFPGLGQGGMHHGVGFAAANQQRGGNAALGEVFEFE